MTQEGIPVLGIVRHVQDGDLFPDQIVIGTPGKGGELKIHFNADEPVKAEVRIREAFRLRTIARGLNEVPP